MKGVIGSFVRCDVRVLVLAAVRILVVAVVRELVRRVVVLVCTVAAKFDAVCVASGVANCEVGRLCLDAYPTRVSIAPHIFREYLSMKSRVFNEYVLLSSKMKHLPLSFASIAAAMKCPTSEVEGATYTINADGL